MKTIALIVGLCAVTLYTLGYLQKNKKSIIMFNLSSRVLYVIQYFLLGAFSGAIMDIAGAVSSVFAQRREKGIIKKHKKAFFIGINIVIIVSGLFTYKNIYSLLPVFAVLLHTGAFWMNDERKIRIVSLIGCPFWLIYNFVSGAYGSCLGDIFSIISLLISITRYDILKLGKK